VWSPFQQSRSPHIIQNRNQPAGKHTKQIGQRLLAEAALPAKYAKDASLGRS
jgi:hypothetical protein